MKKTILALALLASPAFVSAHDFSYTYAEGGYVNLDGVAEGPFLAGSFEFGDSGVFVFGNHTQAEVDFFNLDVNTSELGLGYHHSVHSRVDVFGELAYQYAETDLGLFNVSVEGYRAALGARVHLVGNLDGLVKVNHYAGGDFDTDQSVTAGLEYSFGKRWSVVADTEFNEGPELYRLGARYSF